MRSLTLAVLVCGYRVSCESCAPASSSTCVEISPDGGAPGSLCGMQLADTPAVFCETFDAPAGTGDRGGDLNGNVWSVSRVAGGGVNIGQGTYNEWSSTLIEKCDGSAPRVNAPGDVIICDGQLRTASNDNNSGQNGDGDVTSLGMIATQPFDFAGRTGTISFDVSNDTAGGHGAWPELWVSDSAAPDPFAVHTNLQAVSANAFGIRFNGEEGAGNSGSCPTDENIDKVRWHVGSVVVVRGYTLEDTDDTAVTLTNTVLDCAIEPAAAGQMSHIEVRISHDRIDVYATDAAVMATPATLKHIASITQANLSFTRGYLSLENVHNNGDDRDPARASQREHTFIWDNVAFDGPFTYRTFTYDALDQTLPGNNGAFNLGTHAMAGQTSTWSVAGLPANPRATSSQVLFSFNEGANPVPTALNVIVNGHSHALPWPYPDQLQVWRTYAATVPLTDLVPGTNVVELGADVDEVFCNVDLALIDVPGGVPVLPGAKTSYP